VTKELDSLKVKAFTQDHVPNDNPGGKLPWLAYHTVRNALVQTCRQYGPTGPMGVVKIVPDVENPVLMLVEDRDFWEQGDPDPMYFLLDDQLNHERYCYAELYGDDPFNFGWLLSVTKTLREFDGWGLGVSNIPDSYVIIFGKRLLVKGRLAKCQTATEVVEGARRLLKRGDKKWWRFGGEQATPNKPLHLTRRANRFSGSSLPVPAGQVSGTFGRQRELFEQIHFPRFE
jgi:hypothetical protein